jgi:CIC family chloride channel protein
MSGKVLSGGGLRQRAIVQWARLRGLVRSSNTALAFTAVLVGAGAGAIVTVLAGLSQAMHSLFFGIPLDVRLSAVDRIEPWRALAAPVMGGVLLGLIELWRKRVGARSAVDPVEANALRGGQMSLRDSVVVTVQTLISNGFGASVGLEAGYTQIGGGLASRLGIALKLRRSDLRIMVGCGAAGAIAAAFGAPLTGAFYAFELIIGVYSIASAAAVMGASLAGFLMAQALIGAPYSIHTPGVGNVQPLHYLVLMILGVAACGLGILTMRAVAVVEQTVERSPVPKWARPALGGLIIGCLALITPQVLGAGHGAMKLDLSMDMSGRLLATLIVLKLTAALVSLGSGFRGGLFFASLFVGALLGKLYGGLTSEYLPNLGIDPLACTLTGMGVFAVAVVGGPLTMSFLVLETTGDYALTGAVLAACVVTSLTVREVFGYSFSTWRLHLRGESIRSANDVGWVRNLTVRKLMRQDPPTLAGDITIAQFRKSYPLGSRHMIVLTDPTGAYRGMVQTAEAHASELDTVATSRPIHTLARWSAASLSPDLDIKAAMQAFDEAEADTLAVVDAAHGGKVVGLLTEAYASRRYAEELDKANRSLIGEDD